MSSSRWSGLPSACSRTRLTSSSGILSAYRRMWVTSSRTSLGGRARRARRGGPARARLSATHCRRSSPSQGRGSRRGRARVAARRRPARGMSSEPGRPSAGPRGRRPQASRRRAPNSSRGRRRELASHLRPLSVLFAEVRAEAEEPAQRRRKMRRARVELVTRGELPPTLGIVVVRDLEPARETSRMRPSGRSVVSGRPRPSNHRTRMVDSVSIQSRYS